MKRSNLLLAILLLLQLALAAFLLWPRNTVATATKLIADVKIEDLNELTLADDKDTIHLKKVDNQWVLPDQGNFPVTEAKITEVMSKALSIDTRQLVASNVGNFAQLKVADNDFVRKVSFSTTGGTAKTLIIGNSPNTRATNVRMADSNDVYITNQLVGADARLDFGSWIDTVYYSNPSEEIKAVTLENAAGTFDFSKTLSNTWQLAGVAADETFSETVWSGIASRLGNLTMSKPVGKEAKPEYGFDKPTATITMLVQPSVPVSGTEATTATQPSTVNILVGAEDTTDSSYYVKSSTSDYYVKISSFTMGDFVKKTRSDLVLTPIGALTTTFTFSDTAPISGTVAPTEAVTGTEVITATPPVEAAPPVTESVPISTTEAVTTTQ